jgi:hexosaminidase
MSKHFNRYALSSSCSCLLSAALFLALVPTTISAQQGGSPLPIIPAPAHVEQGVGSLDLARGLTVDSSKQDEDAKAVTASLQMMLSKTHGSPLLVVRSGKLSARPQLVFAHRAHQGAGQLDESYALDISTSEVRISASSRSGYFYGVVSLWQMLAQSPRTLTAIHIEDEPRFRWRGLMLDSARHIQSEQFIFQLLDYMGQHKLNVLHWHLTDDQGWRIEIKRYPKLTSVGAFRGQTMPPYQAGSIAATGQYGGFFTQVQIRRIVAYAKARNVTVVPEIEMPGHASAPLAAYPQFGSSPTPLTAVPIGWGIFPNLYNVDDATFEFLQNILTEVMDLFPSEYIHVGGDEAIKEQWKANPVIQTKMQSLGIKNEDAMQSWFINRIEKFINAHGRRMIGWDEILEGGLSPHAAVMSWRGKQGAVAAAQQGHDAVLTPNRPLYFNYRQSDATNEPAGRDPVNSLADVYNFNAAPDGLTPEQQTHVMGVQGSLWSEYVLTEGNVQLMLFPRAAALAEVAWSPVKGRSFQDFLHRLPQDQKRAEAFGVSPSESVFKVRDHVTLLDKGDHAMIDLSTQGGIGVIHYTLDGSPVTSSSPVAQGPQDVSLPTTLRSVAFDEGKALGSPILKKLTLASALRRDSRELDSCTNSAGIQMEQDPIRNLERPVFRVTFANPCWIYRHAELNRFSGLTVGVGSIPYIFHSAKRPILPVQSSKSTTANLEVRIDNCKGDLLTTIPLAPAFRKDGVTSLTADSLVPAHGSHDLCFAMKNADPATVWLLNFIQPTTK